MDHKFFNQFTTVASVLVVFFIIGYLFTVNFNKTKNPLLARLNDSIEDAKFPKDEGKISFKSENEKLASTIPVKAREKLAMVDKRVEMQQIVAGNKQELALEEAKYDQLASNRKSNFFQEGNELLKVQGFSAGAIMSPESVVSMDGERSDMPVPAIWPITPIEDFNTEDYDRIYENAFLEVIENPLSTFSIDVDTASYANMRRYLTNGQLPPEDAVRIEEMINYFTYDYPQPEGDKPFSITTNAAVCPWNTQHQLVHIGLQGKILDSKNMPGSNLVFLIDTSGSMEDVNKLPLLKSAFRMLVNQLTEKETVSIVVYAGAAGQVLEPTPGNNKQKILSAIDNLQAGGSTAGGAGIQLAYEIAKNSLIKNGNNRVILATDGDFNVGVSSDGELIRLIEEKRKDGVYLTVLGFGMGNYKDNKMEKLANKGNGNYYYIDTEKESKKVLVSELGSTLFTIAKDVKIQIEFNPAQVKAYRLIGYENRMLAKEDFNDDTKDAGELGAGHSVTALYEIVPVDSKEVFSKVDELTYQQNKILPSDDIMTIKLRYKDPDAEASQLIQQIVKKQNIIEVPENDFAFVSAVAEFGLLLRNSEFKANATYDHVLKEAKQNKGKDLFGYREEFISLVEKAQSLDSRPNGTGINFKTQ